MAIKPHALQILGAKNAISYSIFSPASPRDYGHLLNVFAHLRLVDVVVNPHQDRYPVNYGGLGRLMVHATMLKSLDLRCAPTAPRQAHLNLSRVFQNATWPHLKHFGLYGFAMHTNADLIAFFDRHRATLDSVFLQRMFLHQKNTNLPGDFVCEAWKHLFGELRKRSIKFQKLKLFRIFDCHHDESHLPLLHTRAGGGERVLRYLHEGGPNPLALDTVACEAQ